MFTRADFTTIIPVLFVALAACAVLLAEAFRRKGDRMPVGILGLIGLGGAAFTSLQQWGLDGTGYGVIVADNFALFVNLILCGVGILTILLSWGTAERDGLPTGEYHAL